jgi:hypothetical protein
MAALTLGKRRTAIVDEPDLCEPQPRGTRPGFIRVVGHRIQTKRESRA